MKKSGYTKSIIVNFLMMSVLIIMLVLLNLQIFKLTSQFDESVQAAAPTVQSSDLPSVASAPPKIHEAAQNIDPVKSMFTTVNQKLKSRTKIDDFLAPALWNGAASGSDQGRISLKSDGEYANMYRKYDGLLPLGTYLYLDIVASGIESVDWMTLYLMEDLDYANYYEFDLLQALSEGQNELIINKKDFLTGSGTPKWDGVSTVRIAFETKNGAKASVTLNEISTYEASPMCSIWFDDGWKTTYTDAYPVMKEKDFKGILSVVSSYVGSPAFCAEADLDAMYSDGWDFTNHTDGHQDLTEITEDESRAAITNCFNYLESHGFTRASGNMVPPYCATNEETDKIISSLAQTSRMQWSAYNYLPVKDPYHLGFREVFSDTDPETAMEWIDEAVENDLWLVLLFHSIESPTDEPTKYSKENFEKIIGYLDEKRSDIKVVTISEVLGSDIIETSAAQTQVQTSGEAERELIWEEEFDAALDTKEWNIVEAEPFKNNELQTYAQGAVSVEDGMLKITSGGKSGGYISGAVTTQNKQLFQYGRIEIRAKLPSGKGIFPALWMLPQSGNSYPEIDIIEFLGNKPNTVWHVMHYKKGGKYSYSYKPDGEAFDKGFHIFALKWSEDSLKWIVDGVETYSVSKNIPSEKMYLYLNTAIGGNWPGSPNASTDFPQTMLVDYIKYYK